MSMAEDDASKKAETADESARSPLTVEIIDPIPAEGSSKEHHTYVKSDDYVETSFYVSEFVLDFLEQRRGQKSAIHSLLSLRNPVTPIPDQPSLPTTNPEPDTQKSSLPPSDNFQFAVPRGRAPRCRPSLAPCTPPPVLAPPSYPTQPDIPLLSSLLGWFSRIQPPSQTPSLLLPFLLGAERSSTDPSEESLTPPLSPESPSSPDGADPNFNLSPSKRHPSPSSNSKLEPCDPNPKKPRRLIPDEASPSTSSFEKPEERKKPCKTNVISDPMNPQMYPYILNLAEAYDVAIQTVYVAIKFEQHDPYGEKTLLYVYRQGKPAEKECEEKNDLCKSEQGKPTEKEVEEKNGVHKPEQEKPPEKGVEEKNGVYKREHEKPTENKPDDIVFVGNPGQVRKGGPYKNKPAP